jgi:uncharacterized membrane protein YbhN (UPF0104 family)
MLGHEILKSMKRLPIPVRKALPITIVGVTMGLFVYLFVEHPEYRRSLSATNPLVLLLIATLYAVLMLCLSSVYSITLQLCGKRLPMRENLLLTGYSTIVNFFGPFQSGPGVRAAYIKQKFHVKYRDYTLATFVYYAMYAIISALFILIGSGRRWPLALVLVAAVIIGSGSIVYVVYARVAKANPESDFHATPALLAKLAAATTCLLALTVLVYFIELRAVHTGASPLQAIAYGGAANFALFVSLTPGAIGFREAFLEFSRQLHHIPTSGILAASVIDRSVFVVFLGLLFLLTLGMHVGNRFKRTIAIAETQE